MDTGHILGLVTLYAVMAIYALILLLIFVRIFFGDALENHRQRQWRRRHAGAGYPLQAFARRRGWANTWLPKIGEVNVPPPNINVRGRTTIPLLVAQAMAVVFILIAMGVASTVAGQQQPTREASSSDLKKQLIEIRGKEVPLQIRLEQIDQELKPEVIERELAGIGSVHPEELRENRRKLLTIEHNGLQAELDLLQEDRARIEAAIIVAEQTSAYLGYAQPAPAKSVHPPQMALALRNVRPPQLVLKLLGAISILLITGGIIFLLFVGFQVSAPGEIRKSRCAAGNTRLSERASVQRIATAAIPLERA